MIEKSIVRHVAGAYWIISTDSEKDFVPPIVTNETGYMMWKELKERRELSMVAQLIADKYEISYEEAWNDAKSFVDMLESKGFEVN